VASGICSGVVAQVAQDRGAGVVAWWTTTIA
jgi:hypothetical protein